MSALASKPTNASGPTAAWKRWQIPAWNARLFDHYFGLPTDSADDPVTRLLVTPDEFAVVAEADADPKEVIDSLVEKLRSHLKELSFGQSALDRRTWNRSEPPPYVAELVLSCYAAFDSEDALSDSSVDRSFQRRFDQLCGNGVSNDPGCLPVLWEELRDWLDSQRENSQSQGKRPLYRRLQLPDPGGYKRIGYSLRLAFPRFADQRRLVELLDSSGLLGTNPPAAQLLALLQGGRSNFSALFQETANALIDAWNDGRDVVANPLWSAIRSVLNAEPSRVTSERARHTLLMLFTERGAELEVLADRELPNSIGIDTVAGWSHVLTEPTAAQVLKDPTKISSLTSVLEDGVLLFESSLDGNLLLSRRATSASKNLLVRRDRVEAIKLRLFNGRAAKFTESELYDGWYEAAGVTLESLASTSDTAAQGISSMTSALPTRRIDLLNGIQLEGGQWLGHREVLPEISMTEATDIRFSRSTGGGTASSAGLGWSFGSSDRNGSVTVVAELEGRELTRREVNFTTEVQLATSRQLTSTEKWVVESAPETTERIPLTGPRANWTSTSSEHVFQLESFADAFFLGPCVGDVASEPRPGFDWRAVRDEQGKWQLTFVGNRERPTPPEPRLGSHKASKFWRQRFRELKNPPTELGNVVEQYKALVTKRIDGVDERDAHGDGPRLGPVLSNSLTRHSRETVERLTTILACKFSRVQALPEHEILDLFRRVLGSSKLPWDCVRAWQEAASIDALTNKQWRGRWYVPLPLELVACRNGTGWLAALRGLALPKTVSGHRRGARAFELYELPPKAISPFSPALPRFQSSSLTAIESFAKARELQLRHLVAPQGYLEVAGAALAKHDSPPSRYLTRGSWSPAHVRFGPAHSESTRLDWLVRSDAPDVFAIVDGAATRSWSYSRNWGVLAFELLKGIASFTAPSDEAVVQRTSTSGAYLPLPIARMLAVLSPASAGPTSRGYVYSCPSFAFRDTLMRTLLRTG